MRSYCAYLDQVPSAVPHGHGVCRVDHPVRQIGEGCAAEGNLAALRAVGHGLAAVQHLQAGGRGQRRQEGLGKRLHGTAGAATDKEATHSCQHTTTSGEPLQACTWLCSMYGSTAVAAPTCPQYIILAAALLYVISLPLATPLCSPMRTRSPAEDRERARQHR